MGFLDKAKAAAEQAASKAKETAGEVQTKRELSQAYNELGQKAYDLAEAGQVSAPDLDEIVERIRRLKEQLDEKEPVGAAASTGTEPPPSDAPPGMPT